MGSVFGKETVKEPPFDILLQRKNVKTSYEMRKYGERFAASVTYADNGDTGSPFGILASYIGVFGTAKNEGSTSMAMTAPVVMEQENNSKKEPESIAMTAPVVMENSVGDDGGNMKKMMFMLPEEYDDMSKIPKPTNPAVHIEEIPSEVGVVHRYSGKYTAESNREVAKELGAQLMSDGVEGITEEYASDHFQFWGYNPPFTIPAFRRNEVWLKLNDEQVNYLKEKFPTSDSEGRLVGGSSSTMKGRTKFGLGVCGLVVGAYAVGFLFRSSRSQYRRV
mmetsp:Transcript_10315/g.22972  ORF Transcript_10315/g.22972 Transcript_10315/m.22972 type:complete len:278 (+) Transcript_10315:118-951(+)|eukprot:CAMPEP_0172319430 /NCGR_PEP_ID=MMETSP1058-20130122/37594_1 /TAXON_ID=83371 /ORGANISM="Detonula confervacea, Strain CCMP 353" /LENGTH=277 /DNA_ID=CAMNT_0013034467 /DNA_START=89 /DNA_END=922 /DNA_ORIENTATION=-